MERVTRQREWCACFQAMTGSFDHVRIPNEGGGRCGQSRSTPCPDSAVWGKYQFLFALLADREKSLRLRTFSASYRKKKEPHMQSALCDWTNYLPPSGAGSICTTIGGKKCLIFPHNTVRQFLDLLLGGWGRGDIMINR